MNKTINNIIDDFKSGKITVEDANKLLVEAGAGFSLNPEKNPYGGGIPSRRGKGASSGQGRHGPKSGACRTSGSPEYQARKV